MNMERFLYFMFYCHKRPDRSFFYKGKQFPICARCTGICVGYVAGIIWAFFALFSWTAVLLAFVPLVVDGTGQLFEYWESTNLRRMITGTIFGTAMIHFIVRNAQWGWQLGADIAQYLFHS